jgi:hypothetical protein
MNLSNRVCWSVQAALLLVDAAPHVTLQLLDAIAAGAQHDVELRPLIGREIQIA